MTPRPTTLAGGSPDGGRHLGWALALLAIMLPGAALAQDPSAPRPASPVAPDGALDAAPAPAPAPDAAPDPAPDLPAFRTTVSARRFRPEEATRFPQEIDGEEARRLPLIDGDLYRSLHLVPGVVADDFTARFSLRGGKAEDLLTLIDGVPLFDPFHLQDYGGAISVIGLDLVATTRLLGDGFPVRYGDRLGGVVEVTTRTPGSEHEGLVGVDLLNARLLLQGPLGAGGYLVAARRGYIDLFLKAWAPDLGFLPAYWDLFAKVEQRLSSRDRLVFAGFAAVDTNQQLRDAPAADLDSRYTNGGAWVTWQRQLAPGAQVDSVVSVGRATRDRREGQAGWDLRTVGQVLAQQDWSVRLGSPAAGTLSLGERLRFSLGEYDYHATDLVVLNHPELRALGVQTSAAGLQASGYLQHDASPRPWLQTTLGFRLDGQQGVDALNPSPRVALALLPHPTLTLRAAWGLYAQPVLPHELPVEVGLGAPREAEQAAHQVLGLLWRPGPWLHLRLEGYRRSYEHLIGVLPDFGREERLLFLPTGGEARGVEVELRGFARGGRVGWLVGYSLAEALEWGLDRTPVPRPDDRTHALTGGLDLDLGRVGRLSLVYRFHSGQPYTPAVAVRQEGGAPQLVFGTTASRRLPDFHSLDARLSRDWQFAHWVLGAYLQVMNATWRDNVSEYVHRAVRQADGSYAVARTAEGYFPILPTFGLEGRW
ncbi:MAG: TonB-dependent receptor [Myxococcota bacterium]|nr:TonB-dependent receptor [Myxococcota bacterium]